MKARERKEAKNRKARQPVNKQKTKEASKRASPHVHRHKKSKKASEHAHAKCRSNRAGKRESKNESKPPWETATQRETASAQPVSLVEVRCEAIQC